MTLGIGETLRDARRRQRLTLSDAAAETRIRETYLAALEEEEFSTLGGDVYVRGFLRNYAKYLGLEAEPLVETFRVEHQRPEEAASLGPAAEPAFSLPGGSTPRWKIIAGVGGSLALLLLYLGRGGQDAVGPDEQIAAPEPTAIESPTASEAAPLAAAGASAGADDASPTASPSGSPEPLEEIVAVMEVTGGPSWTRATVDGQQQEEGVKAEGTTREYRAEQSLVLRLGDASKVRVQVNDRDLGVIGGVGEVWEVSCEVGGQCTTEQVA